MQALHTAATGMAAQELNVQVISNNIANLQTTGYKKQTAAFQDLIYEHVRRVGAQASDQGTILPVGIDIGGGVKTVGTPRSMTQGTLSQTGNDLDLAITGEGFFKILMPDGTFQYTRDGTFQMDNTGRIVTAAGQSGAADHHGAAKFLGPDRQRPGPGIGDAGGIDDDVHRSSARSPSRASSTRPACSRSEATCSPTRHRRARRRTVSPAPKATAAITQGSLEQSNVDVVSEMSNLIAAQRAYEMNAKVISAADQMLQTTSALFR